MNNTRDTELIDVLTAISVVSKRLAKNLSKLENEVVNQNESIKQNIKSNRRVNINKKTICFHETDQEFSSH